MSVYREIVNAELSRRQSSNWDGSVIGDGTCPSRDGKTNAQCQLNRGHSPSVRHRHMLRNGGKDVHLLEW